MAAAVARRPSHRWVQNQQHNERPLRVAQRVRLVLLGCMLCGLMAAPRVCALHPGLLQEGGALTPHTEQQPGGSHGHNGKVPVAQTPNARDRQLLQAKVDLLNDWGGEEEPVTAEDDSNGAALGLLAPDQAIATSTADTVPEGGSSTQKSEADRLTDDRLSDSQTDSRPTDDMTAHTLSYGGDPDGDPALLAAYSGLAGGHQPLEEALKGSEMDQEDVYTQLQKAHAQLNGLLDVLAALLDGQYTQEQANTLREYVRGVRGQQQPPQQQSPFPPPPPPAPPPPPSPPPPSPPPRQTSQQPQRSPPGNTQNPNTNQQGSNQQQQQQQQQQQRQNQDQDQVYNKQQVLNMFAKDKVTADLLQQLMEKVSEAKKQHQSSLISLNAKDPNGPGAQDLNGPNVKGGSKAVLSKTFGRLDARLGQLRQLLSKVDAMGDSSTGGDLDQDLNLDLDLSL